MVAYNFKFRFVAPIEVGLGCYDRSQDAYGLPHPKRQTIRANGKRRHARPGEILQLYYAQRTKQCRRLGVAKCTEVLPVIIWPRTGAIMLSGIGILTARQLRDFARSDGFVDIHDMMKFWHDEHPDIEKFEGTTIKWEPIK